MRDPPAAMTVVRRMKEEQAEAGTKAVAVTVAATTEVSWEVGLEV